MHSGLLVLHWGFSRLKPHPHNFALQIANVSDFIHSRNVHFPSTFFLTLVFVCISLSLYFAALGRVPDWLEFLINLELELKPNHCV